MKLRIAFLEEWPSLRASKIIPHLAEKFDITYVTSQKGEMPKANFSEIILYPPPRFIFHRGLQFSRLADRLYEQKKIDFAVHYAGIAFLTRKVPIINFLGGSYRTDFNMKWQNSSISQRLRLPIGFLHYSLPELIGCNRANHHIVNSEDLKLDICNHYDVDPSEFSVVYNGVDEAFKALGRKKSMPLRPRALFTGRLHQRKGILEFLEEFMLQQTLDLEIRLAGDGPQFDAIAELAKKDSRIVLLGHLSKKELLEQMKKTNIFIFPSYHEGCPNALLEAMAARHACFCYSIGPVREVLGDTGITSEPGSAKELCGKLAEILDKPQYIEDLAGKSYAKVQSFLWENCAVGVADVFNRFAERILNKD